jgi:O-antigen ligase
MPASSGLPVRPTALTPPQPRTQQKTLVAALAIYAASTLVSMAVMSIGAAIAGVAILWAAGGPRGLWREIRASLGEPWIRRYGLVSLALILALGLSSFVGWLRPFGWDGQFTHFNAVEDVAKYWYFAWPLVLLAGLRLSGPEGRRAVLKAWLATFAAVSLIGVIQFYTGWPRPQPIPTSPEHYHATMFLGHHLSVASILIFPLFAGLDLLRASTREPRAGTEGASSVHLAILPPWALGAICALGFVALLLTYSRTLWVALPIGLVLWASRALSRRQLAGIVVALAVAAAAALQLPAVHDRASNAMGIGPREKLWLANLEFFRMRPLTGAGFRRNTEASAYYLDHVYGKNADNFTGHAHDNLLDMLGGTGVLGTAAWLAWCAIAIAIAWQGRRRRGEGAAVFAWGLLCAWLVFHLNGLTQVNFWEGKVMHQMMWSMAWSLLWVSA